MLMLACVCIGPYSPTYTHTATAFDPKLIIFQMVAMQVCRCVHA